MYIISFITTVLFELAISAFLKASFSSLLTSTNSIYKGSFPLYVERYGGGEHSRLNQTHRKGEVGKLGVDLWRNVAKKHLASSH